MENIYFNTLIKKSVVVEPKYLTTQIDDYILKVLKKKYEGKCIHEGYIKEDSIVIEKKSVGLLYGSHFTGEITYTILFKADVCNPVAGNIIEFEIQSKNQMCLRGTLGPMEIVIPREMAFDNPEELKLLNSYQIGDKIKAEVIKSRYFPNSTNIRVIAKVISLESNKNNKNINKKSDNKNFVSSETNIDDEEMPNAILQNINIEEESESEEEESEDEKEDESDNDSESMVDDIELSDSDNEAPTNNIEMKNPNEEEESESDNENIEENYEEEAENEESSDDEY